MNIFKRIADAFRNPKYLDPETGKWVRRTEPEPKPKVEPKKK
jgi:hypothetical protein